MTASKKLLSEYITKLCSPLDKKEKENWIIINGMMKKNKDFKNLYIQILQDHYNNIDEENYTPIAFSKLNREILHRLASEKQKTASEEVLSNIQKLKEKLNLKR